MPNRIRCDDQGRASLKEVFFLFPLFSSVFLDVTTSSGAPNALNLTHMLIVQVRMGVESSVQGEACPLHQTTAPHGAFPSPAASSRDGARVLAEQARFDVSGEPMNVERRPLQVNSPLSQVRATDVSAYGCSR